jgi:NPCBM/NEW2 domain
VAGFIPNPVATLATVCCQAAALGESDFVSDHPELIFSSAQDWGVLGLNVAAHAPDKEGSPIRISEKTFAKGLGHHTNGTIIVLVDGQYESFDAEVGIQPCLSGSVIFQVIVDDKLRFDRRDAQWRCPKAGARLAGQRSGGQTRSPRCGRRYRL